ncbi:MAG: nucleotidyltransferase family protein [Sphingomonas sp.]|nr:nucleotidyltransferase family protein [Sphingomonas sp.]
MAYRARPVADAELALLLAACRRPETPAEIAAFSAAASASINWRRLVALAKRHRIAGLAYDACYRAGVDEVVLQRCGLRDIAKEVASRSLRSAIETVQLQAQFDAAQLPAIILKGAPLGILAYGTVSIKEQSDIDLLTTPEAVLAARRLLLDLGYTPRDPGGLDERQFLNFTQLTKEATFVGSGGQAIELHWRLLDCEGSLRGADPFADCRTVPLAGGQVRTLSDRLHLPYLACHGQGHGWSRLKWIADVNGYVLRHTDGKFDEMIENARSLAAHRPTEAAILLCHDLLSMNVDSAIVQRIRRNSANRTLHWINWRCIVQPAGGCDLPMYSLITIMLILSTLIVMPNRHGLNSVIATYWTKPTELIQSKEGSGFVYNLARLMGLIVRLPYRIVHDRIKFRKARLAVKGD